MTRKVMTLIRTFRAILLIIQISTNKRILLKDKVLQILLILSKLQGNDLQESYLFLETKGHTPSTLSLLRLMREIPASDLESNRKVFLNQLNDKQINKYFSK